MTPSCSELLTDLYAAGLRLWVEPSGLAVGPRAKMTPELRARVQAHRSELATFVSPGQPAPELHERLHATAARATAAVRTNRPCGPARCWHPQQIDEGEIRNLTKSNRHGQGRGYRWTGPDADPMQPTRMDLDERLHHQQEAERTQKRGKYAQTEADW